MDLWRNLRIFIKYSYNNKLKHNTMAKNQMPVVTNRPRNTGATNMKKGGTTKSKMTMKKMGKK